MPREDLSRQRLQELLAYDPETGIFKWRFHRNGQKASGIAGYVRQRGYIWISVDGTQYAAHRLAWFYVHGVWPKITDHINAQRGDNRLANLRDCTQGLNMQNQMGPRSHNKSGFLGVHAHKKKWFAQIGADGINHYLGLFKTPEEAHSAYLAAKRKLHPFSQL